MDNDTDLKLITLLVRRQLSLEDKVARIEMELKEAKAELRQVQEVDLPESMREVGFDSLPIGVLGRTVEIKKGLSMSIPKDPDRFTEVLEWLHEAKLEDLIEQDVEISFGRGDVYKAQAFIKLLNEKGFTPVSRIDVNTARVKAAVNELLEKGVDVPLETLGGYQWTKAVIK